MSVFKRSGMLNRPLFGLECSKPERISRRRMMTDNDRYSRCLRVVCGISLLAVLYACSPSEPTAEPATASDDGAIDLIIEGDYVVTMDESGNVVQSGAVAVDGGLIIAIGTAADIRLAAELYLPGRSGIR